MKMTPFLLTAAALVTIGAVTAQAVAQSQGEPASAAANALRTTHEGDADGAFVTAGKFMEPDGAKLYNRVCAGCHMPDAKGAQGAGRYPALASNPNLAASGYPTMIVLKGLNGMPPVGQMMTDQQVADVVNYVRTHYGNKYKDAVKVADVKALR
ncbi:c-type cytochrome [Sphingobium nicotianae]|uniref:Cytochrome c n=1 Tax=Sphingobium nicotianae TaxID=2782607 RepID=A0A9X1DAQ3_9SPHN|nr:cytochrome c [Sphingobium nicotianae]MBT2186273.1 cytochrome c [Sphingobium nicotianae]